MAPQQNGLRALQVELVSWPHALLPMGWEQILGPACGTPHSRNKLQQFLLIVLKHDT